MIKDANEDFTTADGDEVRNLGVRPRFETHEAFARIDALIKAPLDFANSDAKRTYEHRDRRVRDVVRHARQAYDYRVVGDIHHFDVHSAYVKAIGRQVLYALLLT